MPSEPAHNAGVSVAEGSGAPRAGSAAGNEASKSTVHPDGSRRDKSAQSGAVPDYTAANPRGDMPGVTHEPPTVEHFERAEAAKAWVDAQSWMSPDEKAAAKKNFDDPDHVGGTIVQYETTHNTRKAEKGEAGVDAQGNTVKQGTKDGTVWEDVETIRIKKSVIIVIDTVRESKDSNKRIPRTEEDKKKTESHERTHYDIAKGAADDTNKEAYGKEPMQVNTPSAPKKETPEQKDKREANSVAKDRTSPTEQELSDWRAAVEQAKKDGKEPPPRPSAKTAPNTLRTATDTDKPPKTKRGEEPRPSPQETTARDQLQSGKNPDGTDQERANRTDERGSNEKHAHEERNRRDAIFDSFEHGAEYKAKEKAKEGKTEDEKADIEEEFEARKKKAFEENGIPYCPPKQTEKRSRTPPK